MIPQVTTDLTLVTGALTSPLWTSFAEWYLLAAGAVLLTLRIIQIIYAIRKERRDDTS